MLSSYQHITLSLEEPLALITSTGQRSTTLFLATLEELHSAVDRAAGDERIRVIGVTGAGGRALLRARTLVRSPTET